jgi:PKD repeat protein
MNRKMIRLSIAVLLILAIMIMSGCAKEATIEETTGPTTPATPETSAPPPQYPPVAQISVTPSTAKIGESITFSGAASTDSDGNITSYEWDFGDGNTSSEETTTHTYDRNGDYVVELTVSDNDGLSNTAEVSVKIMLGSIKIEAIVSSWLDEPYDICGTIKEKLEKAGFEVVSEESTDYDAILLVDYKETKGAPYTENLLGTGPTVGYGTSITCNLRLKDKVQKIMFEKKILATTPSSVTLFTTTSATLTSDGLRAFAVNEFKAQVYFKYLGEIIASKFGVGDANVLERFIQALEDEDYEAIVNIGEPAVGLLIQTLEDEDWDVRDAAKEALVKIGEPAVEPLIQALNHEDDRVRELAAEALGKIGDARAVEPLIQALGDEYLLVQDAAKEALVKIGEPAVEPLIQALKDKDWEVRYEAARALGEIGDERAIEPLIQALKDENGGVRLAAEDALEKIRGY